jgi:hypothetical protein
MVLGILLLLAAFGYRLAAAYSGGAVPMNFAPLMAIALCGGLFLPRFWAWLIPLGALFASNLVLNAHYGRPFFVPEVMASYACYAAVVAGGIALRRNPRWFLVLGASLAASLLFYGVTNTVSFFSDTYAKTWDGWVQALTVGIPGYPPTWTFFRNSAVSDLAFTALYLGCMALAHVEAPAPKPRPNGAPIAA